MMRSFVLFLAGVALMAVVMLTIAAALFVALFGTIMAALATVPS